MKYPSVFLTILAVWIGVVYLARTLDNTALTFQLFVALVVFTLGLFFIGFWRNK